MKTKSPVKAPLPVFHSKKQKDKFELRFKTSRKQYNSNKKNKIRTNPFVPKKGNQNGDSSTEQAQMKTITRNWDRTQHFKDGNEVNK